MFNFVLQWSLRMAKKVKDAAQRRPSELPRVCLIPEVDRSTDADMRKKEVQLILAMMFANLHKRGRPKGNSGEEDAYAA